MILFKLLVFTALISASAAEKINRETYRDLISKAQNLSLQKDRLQATKILTRAALKEKGHGKKELIQALTELSEVFYTDKGQQTFELGRSLDEASPVTAIERYNEALGLEPNNTAILKALARSNIAASHCDRGLDSAVQGLSINPFDEELVLLRAQSTVCLNKIDYPKLVQELAEVKQAELKLYSDLLKGKVLLTEGKLPAAEVQIDKLVSMDSRFPESHYYLGLLKQKLGKNFFEHFQKYVSLCSELTPERRRKYWLEPRLCMDKLKAEAELEKAKTTPSRENI